MQVRYWLGCRQSLGCNSSSFQDLRGRAWSGCQLVRQPEFGCLRKQLVCMLHTYRWSLSHSRARTSPSPASPTATERGPQTKRYINNAREQEPAFNLRWKQDGWALYERRGRGGGG